MTKQDRHRWDERYARLGTVPGETVEAPAFLAPHLSVLPSTGQALDLACGRGRDSVWLARQGLHTWGLDISAVAIEQARELAQRNGVSDRCRFDVVDLDQGLPEGGPVEMLLCNRFRNQRLDRALIQRLAPGGLLAIATLSEVGATPGPFRSKPGELTAAFAELNLLAAGEGDGKAWLLARREGSGLPDGQLQARGHAKDA
ncbi:class I SAM-dependent methyltransferase [Mycobacterium vicinigordonae]|uniref:Class I SAM-dependent methyltransferase n=1 Tax=Mycobacterium vicinigordonae TaxID=1719132 RepID=A0A7D6HS04_9MYCO|nr:class I SAM-dependent methyltransferase [Mycobacterium vicinigordonae]QLL05093.1 class I SAM-dependent methyltransferase [Mycobacterium vicinigordonae]